MINIHFQSPRKVCEMINLRCEDCPFGHIVDAVDPCPEFDCSEDMANFFQMVTEQSTSIKTRIEDVFSEGKG